VGKLILEEESYRIIGIAMAPSPSDRMERGLGVRIIYKLEAWHKPIQN
jgi:hypothetical protein